ncbi:MAG: hypothetical protein CMF31_01195 [Kordiimonas sp.]|nr:hypothetical protein [Kordiimonas sp.]
MTNETENPQEDTPKADPIAAYILEMTADCGKVSPRDVAIKIAKDRAKDTDKPNQWRKYMLAVKQQAVFLARQGQIHILRKGIPVNPNNFRGLVKLSRPLPGYNLEDLLNNSDDKDAL